MPSVFIRLAQDQGYQLFARASVSEDALFRGVICNGVHVRSTCGYQLVLVRGIGRLT